jgi:hypothetical protein
MTVRSYVDVSSQSPIVRAFGTQMKLHGPPEDRPMWEPVEQGPIENSRSALNVSLPDAVVRYRGSDDAWHDAPLELVVNLPWTTRVAFLDGVEPGAEVPVVLVPREVYVFDEPDLLADSLGVQKRAVQPPASFEDAAITVTAKRYPAP